MSKTIEDFINKAIQTAKYAALPCRNNETLDAMIKELEEEGETIKKESSNVLP